MELVRLRLPRDLGQPCYGVLTTHEDKATPAMVFSVTCAKCGIVDEVYRIDRYTFMEMDPRSEPIEIEVVCKQGQVMLPAPWPALEHLP